MNFDNVDMSSFPPYQVPPLTLVYPHMPTPDDIADVKDFSTVCRICTKVTFHVYPIFSGVGLEHDMAGVIEKYLQLKVSADDGLPGVVCVRCARALCGLAALRSTARLADAVLRRRLGLLPPKEPKPSQSVGTKSEDGKYVDAATDPRPPCPQRVCSLCPLTVPTTRYNNHLVTKHVGTVFRCDECHCYLSDEDITFHLIEKGCTGVSMKRSAQKKCNSEESTKREEAEQKRKDAIDRIKLEEYKQKREKVVNEKVEDLRIRNLSSIPLLDFYKFLKFPDEVLKIPKRIGERIKIEGLNKYLPVEKSEPPDTEPPNKQKKIKNDTPTKSNKKAIECSDNNDAQILANNDNGRESHVEDGDENDNEGTDDSKPLKTSPKTKASEPIKKKEKVNEKSPKTSRTCPICGKEYRASSSYFYHMKYFHKRSREHECEVCGKKFGTKANLAQHASVHTGAYDLECKECGKRFRSKPSLYIHEQSHGGVKRWACGQCERSFRWRTHLARHVQRHAAQRAHVCGACGRGFSVRCDMLRHARTHAAAEFHCAACGLKFAQKRYLKVHMIKKHAEASAVVTRS